MRYFKINRKLYTIRNKINGDCYSSYYKEALAKYVNRGTWEYI